MNIKTTLIPVVAGALLLFVSGILNSLASIHFLELSNEYDDILTGRWIAIFFLMTSVARVIGPFIFCLIADVIGRKYSMTAISIPFILAYGIFEFTNNYTMWCAANFLYGLSYGGLCTVFPIYIGELAEKSTRGKLISIPYVSLFVGSIFVQLILGNNPSKITVSIINYVCIILSLLAGILFAIFSKETPSYYVKKGMDNAAMATLSQISNRRFNIELELKDLKGNDETNMEHNKETGERIMPILKSNGLLKAVVIMLTMSLFQLLPKVNYNLQKTVALLHEASISFTLIGYILSIPNVAILILSAILVDIVGRKLCLIVSYGGIAVSVALFLALSALTNSDIVYIGPSILATIMILANIFYFFGAAHIPFIFVGELFPLKKRMLTSAVLGAISFGLELFYMKVIGLHGLEVLPYINVIFCIIFAIVVKLFYLETKGKSLNEIQLILNR